MFDLRNRRVCHNELYDIYFSRKQRAKCGPTADRLSCRISTKMGLTALWWHYTQQATTVRVFTAIYNHPITDYLIVCFRVISYNVDQDEQCN